jgi:choline-sulfatase
MPENEKTNVVFILTDDQGPWAMRCAGNSEIISPNLDRLAETGIRFENFFCASPVCSPARASLLTGRIPSQHGVHDWLSAGDTIAKYEPIKNGQLIEYLKGQPGYTDFLAAGGYKCGISGKWHLGDSHHRQKSFDFWKVHAKGGGPYYGAPMIKEGKVYEEPRYVTDVITDNALQFLGNRKTDENPFYLSVHYTAPHSPWNRENHPEKVFDRYYKECPFDSLPFGLAPPDWVENVGVLTPREEGKRRVSLSGYFTAIEEMDRNVGRILDWLEENDLRENTLVVFTGDNGMNMGHHGVFGKGNATFPLNMLEESVKVPFIISHPGIIQQGKINRQLVSQYDFMPTLLDYLNIENPESSKLPGRSFAGLLKGENTETHDHLVVFDEYGPVRMVRTEDWKYVHRYPYGPNELYNLRQDPEETENLADNPASKTKLKEMRGLLQDWFLRYADPGKDGTHESVTGAGQIGLCGAASGGEENFNIKTF